MPESYQDKLRRIRPPRVKIKCEPEKFGAEPIVELPFVVGIMADLSGMPKKPLDPIAKRDFVKIDRDTFGRVMAGAAPRVAFRVPDRVTGTPNQMLNVELQFRSVDDFEPARVAEQVPVLNDLLDLRRRLTDILGKMEGNTDLENLFAEVIDNTDKKQALLAALTKDVGGETPAEEPKPE